MKKVLFLDIDGVLNTPLTISSRQGLPIQKEFVQRLNKLVEETNVSIVVSSTWRRRKSVEKLSNLFKESGFKYPENIIGKTPAFDNSNRSKEIRKWLEGKDIDTFAVLDDRKLDIENLFKTNPHEGLTKFIMKDIIKYFQDE